MVYLPSLLSASDAAGFCRCAGLELPEQPVEAVAERAEFRRSVDIARPRFAISMVSMTRVGLFDIRTTRSASTSASSMSWVTKTIVLPVFCQIGYLAPAAAAAC